MFPGNTHGKKWEENRPPKEVDAYAVQKGYILRDPGAACCGGDFFIYRYRVKIARILSPFFVTVILVYIVKPLSDRLTAKKIPTGVSVLLVYLFIFAVLAASGFYFIPELAANIRELMETLPQLMSSYESIFNDLISTVYTSNWSEQVKEAVFEQIAGITVQIQDWLVKLLEDG